MGRPTAAFLHLSDLHLGRDVDDIGGKHKSSPRSIVRYGGLTMQAHHPFIVWALRTNVRSAARFVGAESDSFDLSFVTGDISTDANSDERFDFARVFLTGRAESPLRPPLGVSLPANALLCVPGNHDKRGEVTLDRYLRAFGSFPGPTPWRFEWVSRANQTFVFYGIDSNLYAEGNEAVGKITPETLAWLSENLDKDSERTESVRIVLLHHHPADLNRFRRRSLITWIKRLGLPNLTRLEEGWRLLQLCKGRVHILCHGHEHFPVVFVDDESRCLVVSAGTTSQYQPNGASVANSFHALCFDGAQVTVVQFDWSGARFQAVARWRRNLAQDDATLAHERLGA